MNRLFFLSLLLITACAHATPLVRCDQDSSKQKNRSEELQNIVAMDQADRDMAYDKIDWDKVSVHDEERRKRVGEIFGEGCFMKAQDYAAAALVYQHGNVPDHYFQTFLWAKKAMDLGDEKAKWLTAAGIDRYLVFINHKQLFGTQAGKPNNAKCWCLNQVEESFPKDRQISYTGKNIEQQLAWVDSLNSDPSCKPAKFCPESVSNSPNGTVPGFW